MLIIFSSPPFYTKYVNPPFEGDPIPESIHLNPKFYPYLKDAIGAIDGTHFHAHTDESTHQILFYGLLFLTFYRFPYTAGPLTSTVAT